MKFLDKIVNKLVNKTPNENTDRIQLENFQEYEQYNNKRSKQILDAMNKDLNKIRNLPFAYNYVEEVLNTTESIIAQMTDYTGDKRYADAFSYLIDSARWYALYYLNTDKARMDTELDKIADKLVDIYDVMMLVTLKHFNRDRKEKLRYENYQFKGNVSENGKSLITFTASKTMALSELIYALRDQDNNSVWECYNKLGEANLTQFTPSPFPEFD